jgi:hypothetical protein
MMIWMDIIEIAHFQNRGRLKRSCWLTVTRINRKGDAGILTVPVPSAMRFLAGRTAKKARADWMALIGRNYL